MLPVSARDVTVTERMYDDLHRLMRMMAWDIVNDRCWELEHAEVLAELYAKLVEVVWEYEDKPYNELMAIVKTALRNHKVTLERRQYFTFRRLEHNALDIDELDEALDIGVADFSIEEFLDGLPSDDAKTLVREMLEPSERARAQIDLTIRRKVAISIHDGWTLTMTPLLMERALGWDKSRLADAWRQVEAYILEYTS